LTPILSGSAALPLRPARCERISFIDSYARVFRVALSTSAIATPSKFADRRRGPRKAASRRGVPARSPRIGSNARCRLWRLRRGGGELPANTKGARPTTPPIARTPWSRSVYDGRSMPTIASGTEKNCGSGDDTMPGRSLRRFFWRKSARHRSAAGFCRRLG
jgi:hypothetical protein